MPKDDKSSLLYDILGHFEKRKLNLSLIISRPNKEYIGKYIFYFELKINKNEISLIISLIDEIKMKYEIKVLG